MRNSTQRAHALLSVEEHVDDDCMRILGDNIFRANLQDVVRRQREERTDAAFLVEEVPDEEASRYGVCDTNIFGEITDVIEKPADPPSNLVMTGFDTFSPAIFHACELVQPSNRGEYEIGEGRAVRGASGARPSDSERGAERGLSAREALGIANGERSDP